MQVRDITLAHVMKILEPIWTTKTETASRVRGRLEAVLDWAQARGYRQGDNPARWKGHLDKLLPKPSKVQRTEHHAALPWEDMGAFMIALREREGISARALEFLILTAARSGEVRGMMWRELDLEAGVWTIPATRMVAVYPPPILVRRFLPWRQHRDDTARICYNAVISTLLSLMSDTARCA